MNSRPSLRTAGALAAAAALAAGAACSADPVVVGTTAPANAPFMARYVAIGNSITAGYQSGGINDSTQLRAYPHLLAIAAGAPYNYPSINAPGCPPPIVNFLTQDRGTFNGTANTGTTCLLRNPASATAALNNVAVPGANSFDAVGLGTGAASSTSLVTGGYSVLTALFLGGQTQLQRAVQLNPTFATVWIGNNDVLAGAISNAGDSTKATTVANFTSNYRTLVNGLTAGSPNLKGGVLIGVVDVTNTPILVPFYVFNPNVPGSSTAAYGAVLGVFGVAGFTTTPTRPATFRLLFNGNCTTSQAAIPFPALAQLNAVIPAAAPSFTIDCSGTPLLNPAAPASATNPPQSAFFVTDAERTFYVNRVAAYNAYVKAKADSVGFAYLDPNPLLAGLRTAGSIPLFPNLAAPTAPFATAGGRFISNDGVHPSTSAHFLIANALITAINTKYGTSLGANIRTLTGSDTVNFGQSVALSRASR